jgi:hypothetical protein
VSNQPPGLDPEGLPVSPAEMDNPNLQGLNLTNLRENAIIKKTRNGFSTGRQRDIPALHRTPQSLSRIGFL